MENSKIDSDKHPFLEAFIKEAEAARDQFPIDTTATHWEYEEYPVDLPFSAARTHIGMYIGWAIERNLISETFKNDNQELINRFLKKEILPSEIIRICCNDEFSKDHLNTEGYAFTKKYYCALWKHTYSRDYQKLAGWPEVTYFYYYEDTRQNYEVVRTMLDKRYAEWKDSRE